MNKKKYLVIGNPIEHSLSPKLHNYWLKQNNINAAYEKMKLNFDDLKEIIQKVKKKEIDGINVTVPFKKKIIQYLDELTKEAMSTQSVNTIYTNNGKIIGHNTDIDGFENSIKKIGLDLKNKKVLILGAGGVVPSIIFALNKLQVSTIIVSNRTKEKAQELNKFFKNLIVIDWGELLDFDVIINATSIGLIENDELNLDFSKIGSGKLFYDVIYNPSETKFLKIGKKLGNNTINGKMMFIYQASSAFQVWHGIYPKINDETIKLLDK